ncbi:MAG TPA: prolyl oligopeptidase family serine peptidase [Kofleriaceae bacterium]|jgi:dipeptidyl-peptidase-4
MTQTTWPALDDKLLADAAATLNWRLGLPAVAAITPDGAVLFRRTPARDFASDLFELRPDGSVRTLATAADLLGSGEEHLSNAERARRERTRTATRGIVSVDLSEDGKLVLVPLGARFFLVDRASGAKTSIDPGGAADDPHLSPDGTHVAFIRDGNLWVIGTTGAARQLTKHPDGFEYGVADFAAQEELARTRGFWWSPDGKRIAFQRSDVRPVETSYVADARHPERVPVPFKYPRTGTPNAVIDLGTIAITGGEPTWLPWGRAIEYVADVQWRKNAPLTAVVLNRDQTDVAVIAFDGAKPKVLVEEHDDAWINTGMGPAWTEDGAHFLWGTEAPGAWVLQLRDASGKLEKQLTQPEFGLRGIAGVQGGAALVEASTNPLRSDVWRVPFDGSAPVRISDGSGVSGAIAKHGVVVMTTLAAAGGRRMTVAGKDGAVHDLPSVAERPSLVATTKIEPVTLEGRTHYVAITRPRAFVAGQKYPVLLKVYGGPHSQTVEDALDNYVMDQWYADAGFIVVRSDNRGTPNRGRAWERVTLKDLITIPMADQIAALRAAGAAHPELDLDRVGVFGWSFGGYFSAMAVLTHPEIFKAAVAGAPVTDWQLYDTAYTERYMKQPKDNAEGYHATSAMTYAANLSRPLLVIHGITDDNVHFAHSLALIEALYVAGKRAEFITLSATHMVPDPKLNLAREQVQIDFFREHLAK